MDIDTRSLGFELTPALARHVEERVGAALSQAAGRVTRVTVRLDDVNGSRGGVDKRCRVVVTLDRHRTAVVSVTHEDLYAAVDEAARTTWRTVQRALTRHVRRERLDPQRPGALVAP
ncbi:MAG: HPF/RaiA family ribosome-associated protein [Polyangiales bacterium]